MVRANYRRLGVIRKVVLGAAVVVAVGVAGACSGSANSGDTTQESPSSSAGGSAPETVASSESSEPTEIETTEVPVSHEVLTLAMDQDPTTFDPAQMIPADTYLWLYQPVYETMLDCQPDGSVVPGAAESFEFNEGHTELTLHLRAGMTFSDGTAFNSAAVANTITYLKDNGNARLASVTVETPDDATAVLSVPEPTALLPAYICQAFVASPAALAGGNIKTDPVGSGPYTLSQADTTSGSKYVFVKRDGYWNADAYPYQKIVLSVMTDATARLNALKTGEVNAARLDLKTQPEAKASGLQVSSTHASWAGLVIMDRNGKDVPALADVRVRQAINMVFDRKAINDALYYGDGTPTNQIFAPGTAAFLPDMVDYYAYDIDKAKQLMSEAGFAGGFDVKIPSITGYDSGHAMLISQLKKININATQVPLSGPTAVFEMLSGTYPIIFWDLGSANPLWDTMQALPADQPWNPYHVSDPTLNKMLASANTLSGEAADKNFQDINKFVVEQAWFAPWVATPRYFGSTNDLKVSGFNGYFRLAPMIKDFQ